MYNLSRLDESYIPEVHKFIDAAKNHAWRTKKTHIHCPCMDCRNVRVFDDHQQILSHLVRRGFMKDYLIWTKHGEESSVPYTTVSSRANIGVDGPDMSLAVFRKSRRLSLVTGVTTTMSGFSARAFLATSTCSAVSDRSFGS